MYFKIVIAKASPSNRSARGPKCAIYIVTVLYLKSDYFLKIHVAADLVCLTLCHLLQSTVNVICTIQQEHIKICIWTKVPCPNKFCGCPRRLLRKELTQHLRKGCLYAGRCPWCFETVDNLPVCYIVIFKLAAFLFCTITTNYILTGPLQTGLWKDARKQKCKQLKYISLYQ